MGIVDKNYLFIPGTCHFPDGRGIGESIVSSSHIEGAAHSDLGPVEVPVSSPAVSTGSESFLVEFLC